MRHLSLKRLSGGGLGGAPSLGTLEDVLRNTPDVGVYLHGVPFPSKGDPVCGGGLLYRGL
jgi:hypothetical protein